MHQISRNIFRKYIYNKNKEDVQSILASATTGQRFSFSYKMHDVTFLATLNFYVVLGNLTDFSLSWTFIHGSRVTSIFQKTHRLNVKEFDPDQTNV